MLDIYAGELARQKIMTHGFKPSLFTSFLGASGGPKWFTLFGLDKYLFGEFFQSQPSELNLIGSSAGAFRAACFAQKDPVAAITRMATSYSETVYSKNAKPTEITSKAIELLDYVLGESGAQEIVSNTRFKAHFLVNKTKGLVSSENKYYQLLGLVKSMVLNRFDRRLLKGQYQRMVFRQAQSDIHFADPCQFETSYIDLTANNLSQALLASGSIPLVMQGVKNIEGAPQGMYRDGGIIDYHFDIDIQNSTGLTLYPHFNSQPKPGWFDKNLHRQVSPSHYQNIVMLVPSDAFIHSLPFQKIPDRKDFTEMDASSRIKYWKKVLTETDRLAQSFDEFIQLPDLQKIKLIDS